MYKNGEKILLRDIAEKAGVSSTCVSYVINGKEKEKRIGKETVRRIRRVLKKMNYTPNLLARGLRKGCTKSIGLIVADMANPFFGSMAKIIVDEANRYGYSVIVTSSDEDPEDIGLQTNTLLERQVDGFIIMPAEGCATIISTLIKKDIPLVLMDRYFPEIVTNYVVLDNYGAAYDATIHLINNGYKNIGLIACDISLIHNKDRIFGYKDTMVSKGIRNQITVKEVRYSNIKNDYYNVMSDLI